MSTFSVERSTVISAPVESIYPLVENFWPYGWRWAQVRVERQGKGGCWNDADHGDHPPPQLEFGWNSTN